MYQNEINAYFDDPTLQRALVDAVKRLVAIPSVRGEAAPGMPYGEAPARALGEALSLCASLGFPTCNVENYVGTADLNDGETLLHILGHLDVVGEGTGWSSDPYQVTEKDGLLFGRGVADDKGPVVAALFAMKCVKDLGIPLSHNVKLILGTDEESGSSDIAYYYSKHPFAPHAFTPDSDFPLINVEKGHYHPDFGASWAPSSVLPRVSELTGGFRTNVVPPQASALVLGLEPHQISPLADSVAAHTGCTFGLTAETGGTRIRCEGKNAHAAIPSAGKNAISALLALLKSLPLADCGSTAAIRAMSTLFPYGDTCGRALGIAQADEASGALTLNLAIMKLNESGFSSKFDVRFPLSSNEENCRTMVEEAFAEYGISVSGDGQMTSVHIVPSDSPFVQTLLRCYETYTGAEHTQPMITGGGTYVHDIPGGVAFGCVMPGFEPQMHGPDERVPIADLVTSGKIFAQAIIELCR